MCLGKVSLVGTATNHAPFEQCRMLSGGMRPPSEWATTRGLSVNAAASGRTYELDESVQFCAGGQLPTVPLFIQNTSNLLSIENTLTHLVEVPQDGRRRGLKFRLSTSRHFFIIAYTSWYIYQLSRCRIIWVLVPLLSVSFEKVLISFMCRYIYLHMKLHIISAQATSGTIGNARKVAD